MMDLIIIYAVTGILILGILAVMVYMCREGIYMLFGDFIERAIKIKKARK